MERIINITSLLIIVSEVFLFIIKRSKSDKVSIRKDKSSMLLLWLVITGSIFASVYLARMYPHSERFVYLQWAGVVIVFAVFAVRWTAIYQLKEAFTVDVVISKNHKVKSDGLYKQIRHPSYLGLILELSGLSLLFNSWLPLFVINIPVFLALHYRINVEEELLISAFGKEYEEYKKRTKRILTGIY